MTQTNWTPIQEPLVPPLADGPTEAQPADAAISLPSPTRNPLHVLAVLALLPRQRSFRSLYVPAELPPGRGRGWGFFRPGVNP